MTLISDSDFQDALFYKKGPSHTSHTYSTDSGIVGVQLKMILRILTLICLLGVNCQQDKVVAKVVLIRISNPFL